MERVASLCTVRANRSKRVNCLLRYDRFTEGFDMRDIKKAKALLDEVASVPCPICPSSTNGTSPNVR